MFHVCLRGGHALQLYWDKNKPLHSLGVEVAVQVFISQLALDYFG